MTGRGPRTDKGWRATVGRLRQYGLLAIALLLVILFALALLRLFVAALSLLAVALLAALVVALYLGWRPGQQPGQGP